LLFPGAEKREVAMRTHALLSVLALSAVLAAPPLAGAADRHPSSRGGHGDYRSSAGRSDRHRAPHHRYDNRSRRPAPHYRYAPRYRYDAPRYRYYGPRYRYYGRSYSYRPYSVPWYYRTYSRPYVVAPYPAPVYPYGYAPYHGGVHGGVSLGLPGFGFSLYF